jgi:hypothetical protein
MQAETTDLKLAHFAGRSLLRVAAWPSISLIPSARFTDAQTQKKQVSYMKTTQNILTLPRRRFFVIGGAAFTQTPDKSLSVRCRGVRRPSPKAKLLWRAVFLICAAKVRW